MTQILKQSTAVDVLIGPFLDKTDAATAEPGESPSVKLSKNGQALAAKNDATTPVHDADGYYNCELDATDTNTVGTLILTVAASGAALPVRHEYQVVEEAIYDDLFASGAVGYLKPTTAGRTLDVTTGGNAGIDWGNVQNPTASVSLDNTSLGNLQVVGAGAISSLSFQANSIVAGAIAAGALDGKGDWNIGKTGYDLNDDQSTVTVGTATNVTNPVVGDQTLDGAAVAGTLSTTEMTTDLTVTVADQYNDRTIVFKDDTTTASLRGVVADISDTVVTGSKLTFGKTLPATPAVGDTFRMI